MHCLYYIYTTHQNTEQLNWLNFRILFTDCVKGEELITVHFIQIIFIFLGYLKKKFSVLGVLVQAVDKSHIVFM